MLIAQPKKVHRPIRLGIDCRLAGAQHAGIGRYVQQLVQHLVELSSDFTWVCFFSNPEQAHTVLANNFDRVEVRYCQARHYSLNEQFVALKIFSVARLDLLHVPHFNVPFGYNQPFVVTIHDLLWHEHRGRSVTTLPAWQYWVKHFAYKIVAHHAITQAKAVFVPSEVIKKTIQKYYPSATDKVLITPEGVNDIFFLPGQTSRILPQPYFIYVGSLYPHKNLQVVLRALQQLPQYHLVIVGTRSVFLEQTQKQVQELKLSDRVQFLGYIPDQELVGILKNAAALVQPSLSEGFGLTGVEAMAVGTPVLASNIPIFHEIYKNAALFFNPHDPNSFVHVVKNTLPSQVNTLREQGRELAAHYRWSSMAEQTLNTYKQILHTA